MPDHFWRGRQKKNPRKPAKGPQGHVGSLPSFMEKQAGNSQGCWEDCIPPGEGKGEAEGRQVSGLSSLAHPGAEGVHGAGYRCS